MEKEQCRVVRAGVSSVDLQWHATEAKAGSYMLGIADQAVMIRQQSIHEAGETVLRRFNVLIRLQPGYNLLPCQILKKSMQIVLIGDTIKSRLDIQDADCNG